jgi:L-gulonolactone oxidase
MMMLAEVVDEHRSPGNRRVHAVANLVAWMALCALASTVRLPLPGLDGPLDLGVVLAALELVFFLSFDVLSAALVAAVGLGAAIAWREVHGALWVRAGVPFLVFEVCNVVVIAAHTVFCEPYCARPPKAPLYRVLRALYIQAFASVQHLLITLLDYGYRPAFRARVNARAKEHSLFTRHPWKSWAGLHACAPQTCFYPETVDDLVTIVREAARSGKKVRVVGSGHSFSALCPTDDFLVFTARMRKVEVDLRDPARPLARVQAGATNRDLNDALERHGLALPFNVVLESVRVVSLIATGSHGSGWNNPTLSDLVESLEIVTANGEIRTFSEAADGSEIMAAARLNLGLFGIIHRATLRVVPNFRVRHVDRHAPMAETIRDLATLVPAHAYFDLFWWPFNDAVWIKTLDPTDLPATDAPRKRRLEGLTTRLLVEIAKVLAARTIARPELTPEFCRSSFRYGPRGEKIVNIVEGVHHRRAIEALPCRCVEFAFAIDPAFANVATAWNAVVELTERWARDGRYPFNLTMNARFVSESGALLSPAHGSGHVCYIEILSYRGAPGWDEFAAEVAHAWMKLPGARPHWAKELDVIPGGAEWLRAALGENLTTFQRVRDGLGPGPRDLFTNPLMEAVFGGAGAESALPTAAE